MRTTEGNTDAVYDNLYGTPAMSAYRVVLRTDHFLVYERREAAS